MANKSQSQYGWLLNASLVLAVVLEVVPTEIGVLTAFVLERNLGMYIVAKLGILIVILVPLGVYIYVRTRKVKEERTSIWNWKLVVIAGILSINLLMNSVVIVRWLTLPQL
jgi:hypothetical protein